MKDILILACAALLCGCAGRLGRLVQHDDKVEITQVNQLVGNNLTKTPFDQKVVYLNARCETKPSGERKYYLFTEVITPDEFVLQPGESLILNLDDEILMFAPTNSPSVNARKRFVTTFYPVSPGAIVKLAKAMEARVRIKGVNAVLDKKLSRRNSMLFWDFAEKCALIPMIEANSRAALPR